MDIVLKTSKHVLSTRTTMESIFVLIFTLFGVCMFDGIAEHDGRKTELPLAICF